MDILVLMFKIRTGDEWFTFSAKCLHNAVAILFFHPVMSITVHIQTNLQECSVQLNECLSERTPGVDDDVIGG